MTAQVTDGRVAAWCSAWQLLESAAKLRMDQQMNEDGPVGIVYRSLMHEADLYTQLANMPAEVGFVTGSWLTDRWDARVEAESNRTASMFEEYFDRKKDEGDGE